MIFAKSYFFGVLGISLALFAVAPTQSDAEQYGFHMLTGGGGPDLSQQLSVGVGYAGQITNDKKVTRILADFTFKNAVGKDSSITSIYFFDGAFRGAEYQSILPSDGGVNFTRDAKAKIPPQLFWTVEDRKPTLAYSTAVQGNPVQGIDRSSEWLTLRFLLKDGQSIASLLKDLESGNFIVGLHVTSIGDRDYSQKLVNNVVPVPVPAALLVGLFGMGVTALKLRKYA